MPQDVNGEIKVRLGVLSHADVGLPGRQLVQHPAHGWVSVPVQRQRFEFFVSRAGLGIVACIAVMVLILAALLGRKPWVAVRDGAGDEAAELPGAAAGAETVGTQAGGAGAPGGAGGYSPAAPLGQASSPPPRPGWGGGPTPPVGLGPLPRDMHPWPWPLHRLSP